MQAAAVHKWRLERRFCSRFALVSGGFIVNTASSEICELPPLDLVHATISKYHALQHTPHVKPFGVGLSHGKPSTFHFYPQSLLITLWTIMKKPYFHSVNGKILDKGAVPSKKFYFM